MDGSRFDSLARSLAGTGSRRGVLGGLVALGAGLFGVRTTEAQACLPGRVSRPRFGCVCRLTGRPPVGGVCPCPRGQTDTGDGRGCLACRTLSDCAPGDACTIVTCSPAGGCIQTPVGEGLPGACTGGEVCCSGACTALGTIEDCGFCGDACTGTGETCGGGGTPGVCGCDPDCTGATCGDSDGCGGTCIVQDCPSPQICLPDGTCGCEAPRIPLDNGACAYPCTNVGANSTDCTAVCTLGAFGCGATVTGETVCIYAGSGSSDDCTSSNTECSSDSACIPGRDCHLLC
jgi:hypothetical protein